MKPARGFTPLQSVPCRSYAVDHALDGGAKVNAKTRRRNRPYDSDVEQRHDNGQILIDRAPMSMPPPGLE
jgi:hypothetical protein